jgi:uncharacterized protein (DUF433 family)
MTDARISIDPAIMMGKPCIKGTRITVELILRKLGAGRSFADLLEAYPKLTEDDCGPRWRSRPITCNMRPSSPPSDALCCGRKRLASRY